MITKQELVKHDQALIHCMSPRMEVERPQLAYLQRGKRDILHSSVMQWACYYLPVGKIVVRFGLECDDNDGQYKIAGRWEFHPAHWLSHKSIVTQAIFLIRCGVECVRPIITATLSATTVLSSDHPVWDVIKNADFQEFQKLVCKGAVGVKDTNAYGMSILHWVLCFPCLPT
jgi:hypothetical protein